MKKIYFAPNWGYSSERMVEDYIKQTPADSGIWENITHTNNLKEADYLVIQDNCPPDLFNYFEKSKRLYFSREAMTPNVINNFPKESVVRNSFWDNTNILWTKWWYPNKSSGGIGLSYDYLIDEKPINKNKLLSCIQSDKMLTKGHVLRHNFLRNLISVYPDEIDLYGSIRFANKKLKNNDKTHGLDPYKYCLAFDNQDNIRNFFGTQFTDAILRWTVPIYWGGADLDKYFPEKSFIKIDLNKNHKHIIEQVMEIIDEDDYDDRIDSLK